ncbi:hypothetical protein [Prevotella pectinovora]|uniref:hypothetical protein n=1 Tax=Prevotella pectinovora TaxID=1602169 RepID=UPI000A7D19DE|nr:hypothetical protein [Prevotella pectinovora]
MNYCILVTISRNGISFRYNRMDGDNRFVDFMQDGGGEMPFAIECVGNEFVIGKSALESATQKLAPNAFANIFDTCKEMRTFRFAGRDEQLNKLPFYAIKHYINKILQNCFYGVVGNIDSNVSKLPLVFLFAPELDTDKKLFISSPFEKGGFQNMCSISYHQLLLPVVMGTIPEKQRAKVAIMVSVDKNDLLLQFYDAETKESLMDSIRIEGQGSDPRLKQAKDLIWAGLYSYNYQPREPEEDILREAALRFLNSNVRMVNEELCMSDGSMQDYCLSRDDLDMSAIGEATRLVSHHLNEALHHNGLNVSQCQVILVGKAATDYFENIFGQMPLAYPAKKVTDKERNLMLDRLLGLVRKADYQVSNLFASTSKAKDIPVDSKAITVDSELPVEDVPVPTSADKRKVRVMKADINAKLRANDMKGAYAVYDQLKGWIAQKGFIEWDEELSRLAETMGSVKRKVKEVSPSEEKQHPVPKPISEDPKKFPVVDLKKLRREFHRETADIKALVRTGRKDDAVIALEKLEVRLHHDNIYEFDSDLADIRKEYGLNDAVNVKRDIPVAPAKKTMSDAGKMLQKGQFAEAKRKFASEGNSEMAQACSKLIRAKRSIASYVSGLDSVRRSRNVTSKQNAIKELENSLALYRQYGLVTKEIGQLIEQYKSI